MLVSPIHKTDDPFNKKNYMPVSILRLVSKVYERAMYEQIFNKRCTVHNMLYSNYHKRRNFGGSVDPPNLEQFGGIYFGRSREKFNLAGINFGGIPE